MECRAGCGACCIAPSISRPYHGMPEGKPAGVRCVHLDDRNLCAVFGRELRPRCCVLFQAEEWVCGRSYDEALRILSAMEQQTVRK